MGLMATGVVEEVLVIEDLVVDSAAVEDFPEVKKVGTRML